MYSHYRMTALATKIVELETELLELQWAANQGTLQPQSEAANRVQQIDSVLEELHKRVQDVQQNTAAEMQSMAATMMQDMGPMMQGMGPELERGLSPEEIEQLRRSEFEGDE